MHYRAPAIWVVDTSVLVSAVLSAQGPPARILALMLAERMRYALSVPLLAEYRAVLLRPRIQARHGLCDAEIDQLLETLIRPAVICDPVPAAPISAPDPGDQHLWDLLHSRNDLVLVTGDRLLCEQAPEAFPVITPAEWAARHAAG